MPRFLHTRLCDLLGIEYPIIQAPMAWVAGPELIAAVSNAGGLGVLPAQVAQAKDRPSKPGHELPAPEEWFEGDEIELKRRLIRQIKSLTNKPFGVLVREDRRWMEMVVEEGIPVVVNSGGAPGRVPEFLKPYGIKVVHMGSTVAHAKKCQEAGVDAFVLSGYEGGGHDPGGNDKITTFAGLPQIVEAVDIPVIACGGIADGRGIVAAFMLGAEGVRVGTRFATTVEASNHINHKMAIVQAGDTDTVRRGEVFGDILRSLKNPFVKKLNELETSGAPLDEIKAYMGHESVRVAAMQRRLLGQVYGDAVNGEMHSGQIAGLIKEILPASEVIRRMVAEAEAIINGLARAWIEDRAFSRSITLPQG
ncbi:MAG: nitronate monooxygenase [Chloroflexi bacterium]|nr:nitronate monooxygenase [Chloroflexota bacterium]